MTFFPTSARALVIVTALAVGAASPALADTPASTGSAGSTAAAPAAAPVHSAAQGVAVVALGSGDAIPREEAYALARAVYGSALRPRGVDELRARVLAGDPPPPIAPQAIRELAELRASIHELRGGGDAASRRLLTSMGRDVNARALLVVGRELPAPSPPLGSAPDLVRDAGAAPSAVADGGPPPLPPPPVAAPVPRTVARLFDVETGELDAARYEPEAGSPTPWRATVASVLSRFPAVAPAALAPSPTPAAPVGGEGKERKPFYVSPWFWGAVGGALLVGAFVFFAARDNDAGNVHLQMHVPR